MHSSGSVTFLTNQENIFKQWLRSYPVSLLHLCPPKRQKLRTISWQQSQISEGCYNFGIIHSKAVFISYLKSCLVLKHCIWGLNGCYCVLVCLVDLLPKCYLYTRTKCFPVNANDLNCKLLLWKYYSFKVVALITWHCPGCLCKESFITFCSIKKC